MTIPELERSIKEARNNNVIPRVLVVINPGNPTGMKILKNVTFIDIKTS